MKRQSILGFSSAALILFISVTGFDLPKIGGGGVTDLMKALPVPGNMPVPVPPLLVASVGNAAYKLEIMRRTKEPNTIVTDKMDEIFQRLKEAALADEKYGTVAKELEKEWKLNTLRELTPATAAAFPGGGMAI